MIYTSYFGALKDMPEHIVPVAICLKTPEDWKGFVLSAFAPTEEILSKWKREHDEEAYRKAFKEEILDKLNINKVMPELLGMEQTKPNGEVALICYEEPGLFCHRHLVAEWLMEKGFDCREWNSSIY